MLNYRLNTIKLSNETKKFFPNIKIYSKTKKLTGSASQIKRLLFIIPLALYDKIKDPYDEVCKMILLLRELCCIASAPALSFNQIAILSSIIKDYIHLRTMCFTDPLRPKHEFVMHYPELFYEFGPLKHVWTLRFETKQLLSKHHRKLENFQKNLYDISRKA